MSCVTHSRFSLVLLATVMLLAPAVPAAAHGSLRPEVEVFIDEMARKHDFSTAELRRLFSQVRSRPAILRAISTPSEALPWHQYRGRFVNETRITDGVRFWQQNAATLARAAERYGVAQEIIVATIGIETLYGRHKGTYGVLEALTTLAFEYPRRAGFFRGELEEFLLVARDNRFDALALKGSYAGAMGIAQFMPSSYRRYAVDFDGDGRVDLWSTPVDAIGSVANYYHSHGWRDGEAVVVPADAASSGDDGVSVANLRPVITVAEFRRRGVQPLSLVSDDAKAALFVVQAEHGAQPYLGLHNFYVITRYNRSINYALVVHELSRELRSAFGAGPVAANGQNQ